MGQLLSVIFRRGDDSDFERILSDLDEQIRTAEVRLSDIKLREKRTTVVFLVYSVLLYLLYGVAYFLYLRQYNDSMRVWLFKILPLVGMPVIIYSVNHIVMLWYRRKKINESEHLENLKSKQKLKVEELKKKTAYYATRNLLERYDPSTRNAAGLPPDEKQQLPLPQGAAFGGARAMTTGRIQGQGGLRQRGTPTAAHVDGSSTPVANATPVTGPVSDTNSPFQENAANINNNMNTPGTTFAYSPVTPQTRTWMDRVVDAIVGEEGPASKYALICQSCHTHNGLVLPDELEDIQYFCPKCNYYNATRRKRRQHRSSQLKHEAGQTALTDTPSPMGGSSSSIDNPMETVSESGVGGGRSRHTHRPSLPDLRIADMSDAIEGARARVERDAISEVGGGSGDEQSPRFSNQSNGLLSPVSADNSYYHRHSTTVVGRQLDDNGDSMERPASTGSVNATTHTMFAPDTNELGVEQ